ncbi:hypothetical protein ACYVVU_08785 [Arenicellales bacterium IMCC55707]
MNHLNNRDVRVHDGGMPVLPNGILIQSVGGGGGISSGGGFLSMGGTDTPGPALEPSSCREEGSICRTTAAQSGFP